MGAMGWRAFLRVWAVCNMLAGMTTADDSMAAYPMGAACTPGKTTTFLRANAKPSARTAPAFSNLPMAGVFTGKSSERWEGVYPNDAQQ